MIIGIIHVDEFENNNLPGLVGETDRVEDYSIVTDSSLVQHYADILSRVCDRVLVFGSKFITHKAINYQPIVPRNARNSTSILSTCLSNPHAHIVSVDARTVWGDWGMFEDDLKRAIEICVRDNSAVMMSTRVTKPLDINLSMMSARQVVAKIDGCYISDEIRKRAVETREKFETLGYRNYSGASVFPVNKALEIVQTNLPKYYSWIISGQWNLAQKLSFEEAVFENLVGYHDLRTNNTTTAVRSFYDIWWLVKDQEHPTDRFITHHTGKDWSIATRYVTSHETKVELIPGLYYKATMFGELSDKPFSVTEKEYRMFDRGIILMRFTKPT